ncbi:TetR/AcrR family transcriptional regulator [Paenibacillus fonticola]|uniref:TetR/AcrR family transcriptional regulator n=1 Tax=Paenibacillus fonticola TaxID=379896 RepID=UPI00036D5D27|nr:TetR family transcriptional regulator C-terminal domain-containing protein [Paenibacillus fonticola]
MARRTPEEAERTKQKIMESAKELFIRKGYGATSMEDIRVLSGVSKGSIYYHYKSKEQLFVQLLEQNMLEWEEEWRTISRPEMTATEKLYAFAHHYANNFDDPLISASEEFAGSHGSDPAVLDKIFEINRQHYPIIKEILEEGMKRGEFRQEELNTLTMILMGLIAGLGLTYFENMSKDEILAIHQKAIDLFLQGISHKS